MIANTNQRPAAQRAASNKSLAQRGMDRCENLVLLKGNGDGAPLFCFHPIDGQLQVYRNLVKKLPQDLTVFGLKAGAPAESPQSLTGLSERYVDAMLETRPYGPYRLAGFSFGAIVAMHVAAVLEGRGAMIESIAIIDYRPVDASNWRAQRDYLADYICAVHQHYGARMAMISDLPPEALQAAARATAEHFLSDHCDISPPAIVDYLCGSPLFEKDVRAEFIHPFVDRLFGRIPLLRSSRLRRLQAPLSVWRAEDGIGAGSDGWRAWTAGSCEESVLTGNHLTVMQSPHVHALARQLGEVMNHQHNPAMPLACA